MGLQVTGGLVSSRGRQALVRGWEIAVERTVERIPARQLAIASKWALEFFGINASVGVADRHVIGCGINSDCYFCDK